MGVIVLQAIGLLLATLTTQSRPATLAKEAHRPRR
jgi:hypothetical protein